MAGGCHSPLTSSKNPLLIREILVRVVKLETSKNIGTSWMLKHHSDVLSVGQEGLECFKVVNCWHWDLVPMLHVMNADDSLDRDAVILLFVSCLQRLLPGSSVSGIANDVTREWDHLLFLDVCEQDLAPRQTLVTKVRPI